MTAFARCLKVLSQYLKALIHKEPRNEGAKRSLTLTTCFPDKFTCDDGSCVRINQRCNLAVDCRDESDEKGYIDI